MKRSVWLIYLVSSEISNSAIIHSSILQELTYLKKTKKKQRISKLICNDMSGSCLGLLKIKIFWNQDYDVIISFQTSPTKCYHVIQNILYMWSCHKSFVTLAFLWKKFSERQFYKYLTRKINFFDGYSSEPLVTSEVNSSVLPIQGQSRCTAISLRT